MTNALSHYLSVTDTFYHHKINNKRASRKHHPVVFVLAFGYSRLKSGLVLLQPESYPRKIGRAKSFDSKQGKKELSVQHSLNLIMNRHQTQIEKHSTKWQNSTLPNVSVVTDEGKLWNCSRKRRYILAPFDNNIIQNLLWLEDHYWSKERDLKGVCRLDNQGV